MKRWRLRVPLWGCLLYLFTLINGLMDCSKFEADSSFGIISSLFVPSLGLQFASIGDSRQFLLCSIIKFIDRSAYFLGFVGDPQCYSQISSEIDQLQLTRQCFLVNSLVVFSFLDQVNLRQFPMPIDCMRNPSIDCMKRNSLSFSYFYAAIEVCPAVFLIESDITSNREFLMGNIYGNSLVFELCSPSVYLFDINNENIQSIINTLSAFGYSKFYFHVYFDSDGSFHWNLLVPGKYIQISPGEDLLEYRPGVYFLHEYLLPDYSKLHHDIATLVLKNLCPNGRRPPCRLYRQSTAEFVVNKGFNITSSPVSSDNLFFSNVSSLQEETFQVILNWWDFVLDALSCPVVYDSHSGYPVGSYQSWQQSLDQVQNSIFHHLFPLHEMCSSSYEDEFRPLIHSISSLSTDFNLDLRIDVNYLHSDAELSFLASSHCYAWVQRLFNAAIARENDKNVGDMNGKFSFQFRIVDSSWDMIDLWNKELRELCSQCSDRIYSLMKIQMSSRVDAFRQFSSHSNDETLHSTSKVSDAVFHPERDLSFLFDFNSSNCFETIWCHHTQGLLKRIAGWQLLSESTGSWNLKNEKLLSFFRESSLQSKLFLSPIATYRTCQNSKILLFTPLSNLHGIGSMFLQIVAALRFAICHSRILVVVDRWNSDSEGSSVDQTLRKWASPGCSPHIPTFSCYFRPWSGCIVSPEEISSAIVSHGGDLMETAVYRNSRIVRLEGLPQRGHCSICDSDWSGDLTLFGTLPIHHYSFHISSMEWLFNSDINDVGDDSSGGNNEDGGLLQEHIMIESTETRKSLMLQHFTSFLTSIKLPWSAVALRFLLSRPRPWFARLIRQVVVNSLRRNHDIGTMISEIPRPFASLHIRYGMKIMETNLYGVARYMQAIQRKAPHIKNIFISTESQFVIDDLIRNYSSFNFYYLNYERLEVLDFYSSRQDALYRQDYFQEFLFSMANLYTSQHADAFFGTLTSSWCQMIQYLERTRGDGGFDYHSVDFGSAYSVCF